MWTDHILCLQSPADRHWDVLQFGTIMNKPAVNILVPVFITDAPFLSLRWVPQSRKVRSCGKFMFSVLETVRLLSIVSVQFPFPSTTHEASGFPPSSLGVVTVCLFYCSFLRFHLFIDIQRERLSKKGEPRAVGEGEPDSPSTEEGV